MPRSVAVLLLLALLTLPVCLWAQATPSRAPAPAARAARATTARATTAPATTAPSAVVTVTGVDGGTLRGRLIDSDPDTLTVEPTPTAGVRPGPVKLPWSSVRSVSSGLTREKAAEQWKQRHKDELCPDCKGNRRLTCDSCKGVGHDPAASRNCKTCKGGMTAACKAPRCKNGKIPCPGPCLKLTEGVWKKYPERGDALWHEVPFTADGRKMTGYFSEGHVGEIVKFDARGRPTTTPCPTCGKTGQLACPTCGGTAAVPCPTCAADKAAPDCKQCEVGKRPCATCGGSGLTTKQ